MTAHAAPISMCYNFFHFNSFKDSPARHHPFNNCCCPMSNSSLLTGQIDKKFDCFQLIVLFYRLVMPV